MIVGLVALRRVDAYEDSRARSRATIGAVLGTVAIVLGVSAAFFLPRVIDRVDGFFSGLQDDVNKNVRSVNKGLQSDVNSLDRTLTRDLGRLEIQNRRDLDTLEKRTSDALAQLENRLTAAVDKASASEKQDLATLEQSLREDIRVLEAAIHTTDSTFATQTSAFEARIARIEKALGIG